MSPESLWIKIPEIILIPLFALFLITLIKGATARKPFSTEEAVDIAMDLAVLATGACGSIFANDTLYKKWGIGLVVYGILVTLGCIVVVGILAWIRRWHNFLPSNRQAVRNVLIGTIPLEVVTALFVLGYNLSPGR
jgi:hypothetical protein